MTHGHSGRIVGWTRSRPFFVLTRAQLGTVVKSLRFEARSIASTQQHLHAPFRAFGRWRHPDGQIYVDDDCDLIIDGYQGSANTFAVRCFRSAQTDPTRIAHHCHAPEQVAAAIRRQLPAMLTLREPVGAVRSTVRRWPQVSPRTALRGYVRYYEAVEPLIDSVFVADFDSVTSDFGAVIESFNRRFGTSFGVFEHTAETSRVGYDPRADRIDAIAAERQAAGQRLAEAASEQLLDHAFSVHKRILCAAGLDSGEQDGAPRT